jgi:hypothetical protein
MPRLTVPLTTAVVRPRGKLILLTTLVPLCAVAVPARRRRAVTKAREISPFADLMIKSFRRLLDLKRNEFASKAISVLSQWLRDQILVGRSLPVSSPTLKFSRISFPARDKKNRELS